MKTLSVKQVADVLGVSERAILKRLNNGQLKGTRRTNKYNTEVWWVYPNKDIRTALEESGRIDILGGNDALSESDVVEALDAQTIFEPPDDVLDASATDRKGGDSSPEREGQGAWAGQTRAAANGVAEELWSNLINRFLGELKERDQLIGAMRNELSDKDRQLKLLPDLEKQAEAERQAAELKELEAVALRKQIAAMQAEQTEADQAKQELERTLVENQRKAEEEIERLKEEKEAQVKAIQEQFQALSATVQDLQKPWWKKLFSAPADTK